MAMSKGWSFWKQFGERPLCLAPMAEVNDLPFRLLCRRYGIKVCWTGMLNAIQWNQSTIYHDRMFATNKDDHPLIAQLAGGDFDEIIRAARDIVPLVDALEINLGCTQRIASRGNYGYFLVNTSEKRLQVLDLFRRLSTEFDLPISAKVRVFMDDDGQPDINTTIDFCRQLEANGVSLIHLHGRYQHRDKKADVMTDTIKAVVVSVSCPVIANGGVCSKSDADSLFDLTGAAGVSIGQRLLTDPTVFGDIQKQPKEFAMEYLQLQRENPLKDEYSFFTPRKHMYKFFEELLKKDTSLCEILKDTTTIDQLEDFIKTYI